MNPHITHAITTLTTPVCAYIYDLHTLRQRIRHTRAALPPHARLLYAMKANSHPAIVTEAAHTADGIEVSSGGELDIAIAAAPRHIAFSGPAKTDHALTTAITHPTPVTINAESTHELRRIDHIAAHTGHTAHVALRVNRRATTPGGSHRMTGTPTPFGIDVTGLPDAIAITRRLPHIHLTGLHLHAVSNNLDATAHADFVTRSLRWAHHTARRHDIHLDTVNLGGGIGVDPTGHRTFDLTAFGRRMRRIRTDTTVVFELGRHLTADTGWYVTEVIDLKRNHGRHFAVIRGGTHHFRLPAAWGYSHPVRVHPVDAWPYPWPRPEVTDTRVDVGGELCTPRDVLARSVPVTRLRVGDLLVFPGTGAYGWDISHHDFLHHPHPQVVVLPPR
ncbi:diaminopimelate decarboxylase [Stackebrandtia albiflava]|uniref:Diaminopimelate decarboxylase n=1 Tax=Stackebrandtia albiflava TaxID=406432 RepID=A0A562VDG9_9ACTN|nr:type III PLP-dependent enzyme [Stackebrandtia albiflava]TWJ15861.1 diaminopimelate decarboxylase [Stackebrandtia albiflava]